MKSVQIAKPLEKAGVRVVRRIPPWRGAAAAGLTLLLIGLALLALVLLNLSLRALWSELLYAILIMTFALWAACHVPVIRDAIEQFQDRPLSVKRAFVWCVFALVAIPMAWAHMPYGAILLLAGVFTWLFLRAMEHGIGVPKHAPPPWVGGVWTIGLVALLATGPPKVVWEAREPPPRAAPESAAAAVLAERVRPLLFFDQLEPRFPVNISAAIAKQEVQTCHRVVSVNICADVKTASDIDLSADYLKFKESGGPPGGNEDSAYYYRVSRLPKGERLYVDYWWYFTRNPNPVGTGFFCAPGFRLGGKTCHEHAGDWEGVTVVLSECRRDERPCLPYADKRWKPVAVRYAQHNVLVSYAWHPTLMRLWRQVEGRDRWRPVVFIARHSHASYAGDCRRECKQYLAFFGVSAPEREHDGGLPWRWNSEGCPTCLAPLPLTHQRMPASWHAFGGQWGDQHCLLAGAYCDAADAPTGPSKQRRYTKPWQPGPWLCLAQPALRRSTEVRPCAKSMSPEESIQSHWRPST